MRTGKDPILRTAALARFFPKPKVGGHTFIQRKRPPRCLRFAVTDLAEVDGASNQDF
jgi:hypothetical protein